MRGEAACVWPVSMCAFLSASACVCAHKGIGREKIRVETTRG